MKFNNSIWRRFAFFTLLTTFTLSAFTLSVTAQPGVKQLPAAAKRYAIVIGVNQYDDPQISPLSGAGNDAKTLADSLIVNAGFPKDNVILLTGDQPAERKPTRGNILRRLSNLVGVLPKDGLLLFAFAGHGIERNGKAFLLTSDSQAGNDVKLLDQTAIEIGSIKESIRATGVGQVLLILDACRDDPSAGRGTAKDNPMSPALTKGLNLKRDVTAFATIYATEIGKRAYELKEKNQGYFTFALIEGLKGAAANDKGDVTLGGLVKYLQEKVPQKVALDLGKGKEQKPFAVIEGYKADELILATKGIVTGTGISEAMTTVTKTAETTGDNLTGTIWVGNTPETGEFIWEFLPDGKMKQSFQGIKNGAKTTMTANGTWKQAGKNVQVSFGYSVMSGKVEDGVLKLKGTNVEGVDFSRTLFPKIQ